MEPTGNGIIRPRHYTRVTVTTTSCSSELRPVSPPKLTPSSGHHPTRHHRHPDRPPARRPHLRPNKLSPAAPSTFHVLPCFLCLNRRGSLGVPRMLMT